MKTNREINFTSFYLQKIDDTGRISTKRTNVQSPDTTLGNRLYSMFAKCIISE